MGRPNGRSFLLNLLMLYKIGSKQRCRRRLVSVSRLSFSVFRSAHRMEYMRFPGALRLHGNSCFVLVAKEKLDFWFFKMDRKA